MIQPTIMERCGRCGHKHVHEPAVPALVCPNCHITYAASRTPAPALGRCTCYSDAPTVPVCRDPMTHLDECPAKGSGYPVGAFPDAARAEALE